MTATNFSPQEFLPVGVCNLKIIFLSDCNWTRTHVHLVRKRALNHLECGAIECGFTLKRVRDMTRTCSHNIFNLIVKTLGTGVH